MEYSGRCDHKHRHRDLAVLAREHRTLRLSKKHYSLRKWRSLMNFALLKFFVSLCKNNSKVLNRRILLFSSFSHKQVSKYWNILALDGSNWQKIDLFYFQMDIEVSLALHFFEKLFFTAAFVTPAGSRHREHFAALRRILEILVAERLPKRRRPINPHPCSTLP